jgi:F-type H+-transporting ATPase subunit delta
MAELRTLARPYAEAVFELAGAGDDLAAWSGALDTLAAIVANEDVAALIGNPRIDDRALAEALVAIAGDALKPAGGGRPANLVRLLAENDRLRLLPEIAAQYADLRAVAENRVDVAVRAAAELGETQRRALAKALEKRLARQVSLSCTIDEDLIGGAVVRAGDLVIDGSVRAQLARLSRDLAH